MSQNGASQRQTSGSGASGTNGGSGQGSSGTSGSTGQQQKGSTTGSASAGQQQQGKPQGPFSASDLNRIVLEYLNKKGYHRTEAMLRAESGRTLTPENKQSPANTKTGTLPEPSTAAPSGDKQARPVSNYASTASLPAKRDYQGVVVASAEQIELATAPESYIRAYLMFKNWVDASLEIYKPELSYIMYPIFIYMFLDLVVKDPLYARRFFDRFSEDFKVFHGNEINRLFSVNSIDHIKENEVASAFQNNRYRISISRTTLNLLLYFLNENEGVGGSLIISIINQHLDPNVKDTVTSKDKVADGIKVLTETSGDADINEQINSAPVRLGPFPKDEEFVKEVESELKLSDDLEKKQSRSLTDNEDKIDEKSSLNDPKSEKVDFDESGKTADEELKPKVENEAKMDVDEEGSSEQVRSENSSQRTLLQEYRSMNNRGLDTVSDFEQNLSDKKGVDGNASGTVGTNSNTSASVKLEDKKGVETFSLMDPPAKEVLPLPMKTALDVKLEIQKVKESRDAIKLDNLQMALPSVCMYTFHNTNRDATCLEFSDDCRVAAVGFRDSYIKVWSLDGSSIVNEKYNSSFYNQQYPDQSSSTLIGHSGTVYSTSFSPDNRYLLSSSEDKTVRLWSMDTQTALVSYKGHNHPVWDVSFSPLGHYFASASHDQTARLWSCDHIYPLRIFAGHLNDVDCVSFHPNGCYVFTGSSDKTCRMWDISSGNSVRLFLGHTAPVVSTCVSPDGRWLSTGSDDGIINLWDIGTGKRIKQMRGHGKSAIYSLSYNKEGNALISGGADQSIRVWDLKKSTAEPGSEPEQPFSGYIGDVTASINQDIKEYGRRRTVIPTNDLVASFFTKKTPVFKVKFTRSNLAIGGGPFRE